MLTLVQDAVDFTSWPEVVREYGAIAVLIGVVWLLLKERRSVIEKVESAYQELRAADARLLDMMTADRNEWRNRALDWTGLTEKAVGLAERRHESRESG